MSHLRVSIDSPAATGRLAGIAPEIIRTASDIIGGDVIVGSFAVSSVIIIGLPERRS